MLVVVVVGMRTEAEPCSLGRSGGADSNERRGDPPVRGSQRLHVLVAPLPRVIFLGFSHDNSSCSWRQGWRGFSHWLRYFCKLDPLLSVVHLYRSVLPFAHQRLAFCRAIPAVGLQLKVTTFMADHPIVANRPFCLQTKDLAKFPSRWLPPVIVLRLGRCPPKTAIVCRQILVFQKLIRCFVAVDPFPSQFLYQAILMSPVASFYPPFRLGRTGCNDANI